MCLSSILCELWKAQSPILVHWGLKVGVWRCYIHHLWHFCIVASLFLLRYKVTPPQKVHPAKSFTGKRQFLSHHRVFKDNQVMDSNTSKMKLKRHFWNDYKCQMPECCISNAHKTCTVHHFGLLKLLCEKETFKDGNVLILEPQHILMTVIANPCWKLMILTSLKFMRKTDAKMFSTLQMFAGIYRDFAGKL